MMLVFVEGGTFPVYDLVGGAYGTPLPSPFTSATTFSGGALAVGGNSFIIADGFEDGTLNAWDLVRP